MKITLESTTRIVQIGTGAVFDVTDPGNLEARVWEGETESGIKVYALIPRLAAHTNENQEQFQRELMECKPPTSAAAIVFPARMVL